MARPAHHTYQAGDGAAARAEREEASSWSRILFRDPTLTAARMHSVGALGPDERLLANGTLTIARRRAEGVVKKGSYGELKDLFERPGGGEPPKDDGGEAGSGVGGGDDDEEEGSVELVAQGGSLGAAAFGIVKGTVGPAILYLPHGFHQSGYAVGIPAMIFATGMFIYNSYKLLECWRIETEKNKRLYETLEKLAQGGYGSTEDIPPAQPKPVDDGHGGGALLSYPELAKRALGKWAAFVEVGITMFQFGVCLTYLIFVPSNLAECLGSVWGGGRRPSRVALMWAMILVEVPLSWIRDIRKLTPTNVLATLLIAFGLASVLYIAFSAGFQPSAEDESSLTFTENLKSMRPVTESWLLFVGTSFFMMEGSITLIVPLQESVYAESDRAKFPDLNRDVTTGICVFYIFFSGFCSAAFGEHIQTALTASLRGNLATVVQFAYSVAVVLTFPLQAFPAMEVAMRSLLGEARPDDAGYLRKRNACATAITVALGVVAVVSIDYLGNVVSILGSLFGIPLALIFPPLMHNALVVKDSSGWERFLNYCVVVVGVFAMSVTSYNTITTWDEGAEG